jgi:hypothetical protein
MSEPLADLAYYYPQPYWRGDESDGLKNLLLFFDGIAILLPRYMAGRPEAADPVFAGPLRERGLLRILEPETFVDQRVTEALITAVAELIAQGAFDDLERPQWGYAELSRSRMGWDADVELSEMITEELIARDLARPSEDGVSVPLHPVVRMTFLVLLAQLARDAGRRAGASLHPATTTSSAVEDLIQVLSLPASRSAGHVVTLDLETVGVNLAAVPLDEVLEFREQHGAVYKAYARNVRHLIAELGPLAPDERETLLADRREELGDLANDLRKTARRQWRSMAGLSIGAAGAAWTATGTSHDPLGGALALAGIALGLTQEEPPATAYSYLLEARRAFGSRSRTRPAPAALRP